MNSLAHLLSEAIINRMLLLVAMEQFLLNAITVFLMSKRLLLLVIV